MAFLKNGAVTAQKMIAEALDSGEREIGDLVLDNINTFGDCETKIYRKTE